MYQTAFQALDSSAVDRIQQETRMLRHASCAATLALTCKLELMHVLAEIIFLIVHALSS